MRDLIAYQQEYINQPYESYQVAFRKRKVVEILSKNNASNLLEIGCGLSSIFTDFTNFKELVVLEPAIAFFEKAKKDLNKTNLSDRVSVHQVYLEDSVVFLNKKKFDFILLSCLLHEIQNQKSFLRNVLALSSSNTVIHINVPNANSFHRLLAVEMGLTKNIFQKSNTQITFQQNEIFDLKSLINLVEQCGFNVIDSGSYSFKPFTHQQMQNMIDANLLTEKILEGFFQMEKYFPTMGSEIFVNVIKKTI